MLGKPNRVGEAQWVASLTYDTFFYSHSAENEASQIPLRRQR